MLIQLESPATIQQPTPVRIDLAGRGVPPEPLVLLPQDGGGALPAQVDGPDALIVIVSHLEAGQPARYRLESAPQATAGVELQKNQDALELRLPEGLFSAYHFGPNVVRPYLWPLYGPGQKRVTRNYPMEHRAGEEEDHPHHKSLWTAFDEVNGVDDWSEGTGHGYIRHAGFEREEHGPVVGGFTARGLWTGPDGAPVLNEERRVRLYNAGPAQRLFDYTVVLMADFVDVEFGDTKEAGLLSVRVATTMDGARGGLIQNADGGRGEAECWGQRSAWCDYSGPVEGETLGIAVLDAPANHGHPTRWHARDYGLMTTNPLSNGAFTGGEPTPFLLREGDRLTCHYRVLIHRGDATEGAVAAAYRAFIEPPTGYMI
ncbi:MAG TPA: PmoA family protein [Abditibacteriaceae bacterium]|nr:PmoA family protein [Abditibacteriaceae bacterium]